MMDLFEELLSSAAQKILGTYEVEWLGEKVSLAPGWRRPTMPEAAPLGKGGHVHRVHGDKGRLDKLLLHPLVKALIKGVAPA